MLQKLKSYFSYNKRKFAHDLQSALKSNGVLGQTTYERSHDRIRLGDNDYIYLNTIFAETVVLGAKERQERVMVLAAMFAKPREPQIWEEAAKSILPKVRTRFALAVRDMLPQDNTKFSQSGRDYLQLCEDLCVEFVIDTEESMHSTNNNQFECWGITIEDVKRQAMANFHRINAQGFEQMQPGLWMSQCRDNYDDTRILFTDKILELNSFGTIVAFIPNRDLLVLADSTVDSAMDAAVKIAEKEFEHPRFVTLRPFQVTEAGIALFFPQPNAAYAHAINLLHIKASMQDYNEQKQLLEDRFQKTGEDVFVATFKAIETDAGDIYSYSTWSESVPTFLPRTDYIVFVKEAGGRPAINLGMVKWEEVTAICGDRLQRQQSYFPERYFVNGFPSQDEIGRMKFVV